MSEDLKSLAGRLVALLGNPPPGSAPPPGALRAVRYRGFASDPSQIAVMVIEDVRRADPVGAAALAVGFAAALPPAWRAWVLRHKARSYAELKEKLAEGLIVRCREGDQRACAVFKVLMSI